MVRGFGRRPPDFVKPWGLSAWMARRRSPAVQSLSRHSVKNAVQVLVLCDASTLVKKATCCLVIRPSRISLVNRLTSFGVNLEANARYW